MPQDVNKPKPGTVKSGKRRQELRRTLPKPGIDFKSLFLRRELVNTMLVFLIFAIGAGAITVASHDELRVEEGQIMTETRLKRVDFTVINREATEARRQAARNRAPRVYTLNQPYLKEIQAAIHGLPVAVQGQTDLAEINAELRRAFQLDQAALDALQQYVQDDNVTDQWTNWVDELIRMELPERRTIPNQDFQVESTRSTLPEFRTPSRTLRNLRDFDKASPSDAEDARQRFRRAVEAAGFPEPLAPVVTARLMHAPQPIYLLDEQATARLAEEAAQAVEPETTAHEAGEIIWRRGDVLTSEQLSLAQREAEEYESQAGAVTLGVRRTGLFGVVALITCFIAAYLIRFYPKVIRNPLRVAAIAGLCVAMLAVVAAGTIRVPGLMNPLAVSTTLFVAVILVIAYDQRLATMVAGLQCALTTFALQESIGFFVMLAAVCGVAVASLRELRHRNGLIRAAALAAGVAAAGSLIVGLVEVPLGMGGEPVAGAWRQIGVQAGFSAVWSLGVGFLLLGILPSIERLFDMTTGMTLVELRDPRQPLLRQLQERAGGTYNHSLQVASVAEAAADAIGADGLLTYVGALYHDIGKMNKPDYFVENQSGGPSKHEKLSPAMSLLVIVGHVKDGIELAKEYNLPKPLIHFIESHHGTTLVEYFYYAAKNRAEQEGEKVTEVEFRYPGPKPRTKEAAILMLSDAAESATRAMEDPGPASIENLVKKLSRKRLTDGQFDECDLTLRELCLIEDSIIKSIWALHHGRVAYPAGTTAPSTAQPAAPTARPAAGGTADATPAKPEAKPERVKARSSA